MRSLYSIFLLTLSLNVFSKSKVVEIPPCGKLEITGVMDGNSEILRLYAETKKEIKIKLKPTNLSTYKLYHKKGVKVYVNKFHQDLNFGVIFLQFVDLAKMDELTKDPAYKIIEESNCLKPALLPASPSKRK